MKSAAQAAVPLTKKHAPYVVSCGTPPLPPFTVTDESMPVASAAATRKPYTYRGPNTGPNPAQRLHQEFKSLSKEERQRLVEEEAADTDLLSRTVHLRFLPTGMKQGELASICAECGEYLRVRICGNSTNTQNWIYGFVEFADRRGADEMMRRSGMELPNGAGKPPLRLKCNAAKQAIVDRVFHDADPATNMACIFGSGNFAHRTLKEAVDSYHNLKKKEGWMMNAQVHMPNSSHTPSFSNNNHNKNYINGTDGRQLPLPRHHKQQYDDTTSSQQAPAPAVSRSHSGSNSDEESAGITPLMRGSLTKGIGTLVNERVATPTLFLQNEREAFFACQTGNCSRDGYSDATGSPDGHSSPPFMLPLATLSLDSSAPLTSPPPPPPTPPLSSQCHVVERGQALVLVAMRCIRQYLATGEHFYDAIGTLHTLQSVLNENVFRLEELQSSVVGIEEMELLQRATKLHLLVHLLLALLYVCKGSTEEALDAIHNIVTSCNAIPAMFLHKQLPFASSAGAAADAMCIISPSVAMDDRGEPTEAMMMDGDASPKEETSCVFNPLLQAFDFSNVIGSNGEDDQEVAVVSAAMGVLPLEDQDDTPRILPKHHEQMYQRNVQFQSYILDVLLTVGLAMETTHPVVTRCVYVLASRRAKEVLGITLPALEQTLRDGGVHRLRSTLFPQLDNDAFSMAFFEAFDVDAASAEEIFWALLPPHHVVRCFSAAACGA
ncbi:RNA-binding protein [Trypanosoma grayi]|uniref:RNA-binding protein n=1 Tax=Trypanosoma grayi TaxID=71804 RepID=UPI0004F41F87|nr:RNA-binding protein [Trypanosoma grayi]KEG10662.1 RNA-binding protein [Trypanosoma grayi]